MKSLDPVDLISDSDLLRLPDQWKNEQVQSLAVAITEKMLCWWIVCVVCLLIPTSVRTLVLWGLGQSMLMHHNQIWLICSATAIIVLSVGCWLVAGLIKHVKTKKRMPQWDKQAKKFKRLIGLQAWGCADLKGLTPQPKNWRVLETPELEEINRSLHEVSETARQQWAIWCAQPKPLREEQKRWFAREKFMMSVSKDKALSETQDPTAQIQLQHRFTETRQPVPKNHSVLTDLIEQNGFLINDARQNKVQQP